MGLLVFILRMKGMNERALHYISIKKKHHIKRILVSELGAVCREYTVLATLSQMEKLR